MPVLMPYQVFIKFASILKVLSIGFAKIRGVYNKNAATADIYIASHLFAYICILAYLHTYILAYLVIRFRIQNLTKIH